jgi:signal transduction histidine kinase
MAAHVSRGEVTIEVSDNGVGIPDDKLDAIFEPFVQVDAGLTRQVGGTGLGLSIVRLLVTAMDGRIAVRSEVGQGSCFEVTLPQGSSRSARAGEADRTVGIGD